MCNFHYSNIGAPALQCHIDAVVNDMHKIGFTDFSFPHDDKGYCIFHSTNIEWKKPLFDEEFKKLLGAISTLTSYGRKIEYCFAGFVFPGRKTISNQIPENSSLDLSGATFVDILTIKNAKLKTVILSDGEFKKVLISHCSIDTIYASRAVFSSGLAILDSTITNPSLFNQIICKDYASFNNSEFKNGADFTLARFCDDKESIGGDKFLRYSVQFEDTSFGGEVKFDNAVFGIETLFERTSFNSAFFVNTEFPKMFSTCFSDITVNGLMSFDGSGCSNKLFNNAVFFSIANAESMKGECLFNNANISLISANDRAELIRLSKLEKVHIEANCEKYPTKSKVFVQKGPQAIQRFHMDLIRCFTNYFQIVIPQWNMGVEILESDNDHISYFFFSNERIAQDYFDVLLQNIGKSMWEVLSDCITNSTAYIPSSNVEIKHVLLDLAITMCKIQDYAYAGNISSQDLQSLVPAYVLEQRLLQISFDRDEQDLISKKKTDEFTMRLNAIDDELQEIKDIDQSQAEAIQELRNSIENYLNGTDSKPTLLANIAALSDGITIGSAFGKLLLSLLI